MRYTHLPSHNRRDSFFSYFRLRYSNRACVSRPFDMQLTWHSDSAVLMTELVALVLKQWPMQLEKRRYSKRADSSSLSRKACLFLAT